jgi:hypothetical protein
LSEAEAVPVNQAEIVAAQTPSDPAVLYETRWRRRILAAADDFNLFRTKWLLQGEDSPFEFF